MVDKRGSAFQTNLGCPFAGEVYSDYQSMSTGVADKLQGKLEFQVVGLRAVAYYFQTSFCF